MRFVERKRKRGPLPWPTEAALCDSFAAGARALGWTVYPETAGFDLLLVGGVQVGIEAKLRASLEVVAQVCDRLDSAFKEAPDYIAILVGRGTPQLEKVTRHLRIPLIDGRDAEDVEETRAQIARWHPVDAEDLDLNPWRQVAPAEVARWRGRLNLGVPHCGLPEFVPDLRAGIPAPPQLTAWKVKAIQLCARLRARGWVTTADFAELGIDPTRWVRGTHRWLDDSGARDGRRTRYVARPGRVLPDEQRPELTAQVLARATEGG